MCPDSTKKKKISEDPSMNDKIEHVCWYINQHPDSSVSVEEIANGVGLEWAETHRIITIIQKTQSIAPNIVNKEEVKIGSRKSPFESMYDKNTEILSHIFFYNRLNGDMEDELVIEDHEPLNDKQDILKELEKKGLVKINNGKVRLTTDGVSTIGHKQAEYRQKATENNLREKKT